MNDSKQEIIKQAFALFMSLSYKEVTISRLLKATGLSKGAFYHHFTSKEQLFTEVVDQFFFSAASDNAFTPSPKAGFIENMEKMIETKQKVFGYFAQYMGVDQKEINFFMFIIQAIQYLPRVREKVTVFMENERKQIESVLKFAIDKKELHDDIDIELFSEYIMAAFDGTELHGVLLGKFDEIFSAEKKMIKQFLKIAGAGSNKNNKQSNS